MLHRFDENGHIANAKKLNDFVNDAVAGWKALVKSRKFRSLEIGLYTDLPQNYVIIFDSAALIHGLYIPNDNSPHGNDFAEPCIVLNNGTASERLIAKYQEWFDSLFAYWHARDREDSKAHAIDDVASRSNVLPTILDG
jgi:hypothetical protein